MTTLTCSEPRKKHITIDDVWREWLAKPRAVQRAKVKLAQQIRRPQPKLP